MNIDVESIGLLSLILQDSPKDRQFVLCVLARSNSTPTRITFKPNTDYPTFYGYSNSKIPFYLMSQGALSNVPREGHTKRLISSHHLSRMEVIINGAKNWNIHQKLMSVSKFITLDNKTVYKDTEVFLVFRDKALGYIKDYKTSHEEELSSFLGLKLKKEIFRAKASIKSATKPAQANWSHDFKWQGRRFVFGKHGSTSIFNSKTRKALFSELTKAKGSWVTVRELKKITGKDETYVRPTIGQIERSFNKELQRYISIPSTKSDELKPTPASGAYRIKFTPKSL